MTNPRSPHISFSWKYFAFYWGIWLVLMCFYFYFSRVNEYRASVKVKGEVIDMLYQSGGGGGKWGGGRYHYPQFSFTYNDSTYISSSANAYAKTRSVGDKVTLIFLPDKPGDATIYSLLTYWIDFPIFVVFAILAAFIFVLPLVLKQYWLFKDEYARKKRR